MNGTDWTTVRHNARQFRRIPGRGVHGILPCQAEMADAVRAFVKACRHPHQIRGVDPALATPFERMRGTIARRLDEGVRVIAGGRDDTARPDRVRQRRMMPV